jgi:hypothetical protein
MKNKELPVLLEELKKINLSGKIGYAVAKNRKLVEQELETLQETVKMLPEFEVYEKERVALLEVHASKDEHGKAIIENNTYKIENQTEWEKAIKELQETHKGAIESRTKQIEDFNALMEEKTNIEFYPFTEDQIPDSATAQEIYTLLKLI